MYATVTQDIEVRPDGTLLSVTDAQRHAAATTNDRWHDRVAPGQEREVSVHELQGGGASGADRFWFPGKQLFQSTVKNSSTDANCRYWRRTELYSRRSVRDYSQHGGVLRDHRSDDGGGGVSWGEFGPPRRGCSPTDRDDNNDGGGGPEDECCECRACDCVCHDARDAFARRPIDDMICYLFDYDLFSLPRSNREQFQLLIDYLVHENIMDRSYVVANESRRLVGPYARQNVNAQNAAETLLARGPHPDVLRYKPSLVETDENSRDDVRRRFRSIILQGVEHDWFNLRCALRYPTFVVYVKVLDSQNCAPADHYIMVDLRNPYFATAAGTLGYKVARVLAHQRHRYFGTPLPDFAKLREMSKVEEIQRRVGLGVARHRRRMRFSDEEEAPTAAAPAPADGDNEAAAAPRRNRAEETDATIAADRR